MKANYSELITWSKCLELLANEKLPIISEINKNIGEIEDIFKGINENLEKIRETYYEVDFEAAKAKQANTKLSAKEKVAPSFKQFIFELPATGRNRNYQVVRDCEGKPVQFKSGAKLKPNQKAFPMVPDDKLEEFQVEIQRLFDDNKKYDFKPYKILESEIDELARVKFEKTGIAFNSMIIKPIEGVIIVKEL